MKDLNNFIQEKLKVNSKTKINKTNLDLLNVPNISGNYVADKILYVWGFQKDLKYKGLDYTKEAGKLIKKWVLDNNIDDVRPAADPETLAESEDFMPKEIIELYDDSLTLNEECQYRLNSAKEILNIDKFNQIYAAPDVIAFISPTGTLYCLPEHTL